MSKRRKLISSDEAKTAKKQHTTPCSDCPWSRESLQGWLGGMSAQDWVEYAHGAELVACHAVRNQQCAGIAIYRANVCKLPDAPSIKLPANRQQVFSSPMEFCKHHGAELQTIVPTAVRAHQASLASDAEEDSDYDPENDPLAD